MTSTAGRLCRAVLTALGTLLAVPALAEDAPPPAPAAGREATATAPAELAKPPRKRRARGPTGCDNPEADEVPVLDDTRELLEETLCSAALWLDGLFGDEGDVLAARRSRGRLVVSNYYSDFEGNKVRVRLRVRVELPAFKQRLSAFVGRDDENKFVQDRTEGLALRSEFPQLQENDEWLAGLGYSLPANQRLQSDFRIGARGLAHPKVFVQNRFGYNAYADEDDVFHLRSTLFWNNRDGFGVTAGYDFSHVLNATRLVRWDTVGTVTENTHGVDWRTALIDYHNLRSWGAIAYEAFVRGQTGLPEPLGEYGLRAIHRYPLFEKRLFLELVLGYSWPRVDPALPREGSVGAGVGLELPFGMQD